MLVILSILMVALITELSISNVADIVSNEIKSPRGIALFVVICAVFTFSQFYILQMVKAKNKTSGIRPRYNAILEKAITAVQYILTAILLLAMVQVFFGAYFTGLLIATTTISYCVVISITVILTVRLFSWFKISKSAVVLLYALASAVITINSVDTILLFNGVLIEKPELTTYESEVIFAIGFEEGSAMYNILTFQNYTLTSYIFLTWGGTILILRHNIQRVGKARFWILVTLPLIYFTSYYVSLYQELFPTSMVTEAISDNFMIPILLYTYSYIVCGVLFGMGFLSVARRLGKTTDVRDYMIITAAGLIIFFSAGQTTVLQAAFPPYGIANVSMVALSYFLILSGLHYSAISVAHDVRLRNTIKKSMMREYGILDSIGTAEMEEELRTKVVTAIKSNAHLLKEESGISPSLSDEELQVYVKRVLQEIKTARSMRRG
jgi:hypothetical protein